MSIKLSSTTLKKMRSQTKLAAAKCLKCYDYAPSYQGRIYKKNIAEFPHVYNNPHRQAQSSISKLGGCFSKKTRSSKSMTYVSNSRVSLRPLRLSSNTARGRIIRLASHKTRQKPPVHSPDLPEPDSRIRLVMSKLPVPTTVTTSAAVHLSAWLPCRVDGACLIPSTRSHSRRITNWPF